MKQTGRWTALVFVLINSFALLAIMLLSGGAGSRTMLVMLVPVILAAAAFAWLAGRRYDIVRFHAYQDELTGLYNRRFALACFPKLLKRAAKSNKKASVLIVDVNDFKTLNDTYGHLTGDAVLQFIAQALQQCGDKGEIIVRFGGDEFVVICPYADGEAISHFTRRLEGRLKQRMAGKPCEISVSIGTAAYPDHAATFEGLMEIADQRMYADKQDCKQRSKDKAKQIG